MKEGIPAKILLVENHRDYAISLRDQLLQEGLSVDVAFSPEKAVSKIESSIYDVCITGERLRDLSDFGDQSGIELVKSMAQRNHSLRFIINSDFPSFQNLKELLSPISNLRVIDYISADQGVKPIIESIKELYLIAPQKPDAGLIHPVEKTIIVLNNRLTGLFHDNPELLRKVDPFIFEQLVAELFQAEGYDVVLTPPRNDGGKDIYVSKTDPFTKTHFLVECKRYNPPSKVDVKVVRQLFGVVQQERASGGIVVTTSYFTQPAKEFADTVPYQLFLKDFDFLSQWLKKKNYNSI